MLNTEQASIYCGISIPTFRKRKVPFTVGRKKTYKLYTPQVLDEYFPNAPKILPLQQTQNNNTPVSVSKKEIESVPTFEPSGEVQKLFDEIVEHLGEDYNTIHNGVIETLLLVQHKKRFYHSKVMENPLSEWSKLLDQSIKQEASLLKTLGLAA